MKCSFGETLKPEITHPFLKDLPRGTLFMPLGGQVNSNAGPGLLTSWAGDKYVVWFGSDGRFELVIPLASSSSRDKHVRILEPGETVVLENE